MQLKLTQPFVSTVPRRRAPIELLPAMARRPLPTRQIRGRVDHYREIGPHEAHANYETRVDRRGETEAVQ